MSQDDTATSSGTPLPEPQSDGSTTGAHSVDEVLAKAGVPTSTSKVPESQESLAQDSDRIEPQWVARTKQIIAQTATDPYEQNRQLAALRAEYIKQRYNKEIKVSE